MLPASLSAGISFEELGRQLKAMVGFRDVLVHEYTELNPALMIEVIEHHLDELVKFAQTIVLQFQGGEFNTGD